MKDSWIILLDNGESYSDHCAWNVATSETEEAANTLKKRWDEWHRMALANDARFEVDRYSQMREWCKNNPPPEPFMPDHVARYGESYEVCVIKVPVWATV